MIWGAQRPPGTPRRDNCVRSWDVLNSSLDLSTVRTLRASQIRTGGGAFGVAPFFAYQEVFVRSVWTVFRSELEFRTSELRTQFSELRTVFRANPDYYMPI